ncbi:MULTISPECIES: hypothetical protein [Nocardiopsis]|uniref:Transposase n=1 Tax=Nocardiopsis akebiae TaxID=2831968 RepID=A0ABX8C9B9_9ACTN|nr:MULTISPECIES: hypothetical protein [Nocardiopsis]QUX29676.1 hypothetical protein KGD83_03610 [Nocardiopsis akebiae]WDZ90393.1 hypothetical protein PV789_26445 [Nocardiopsis sp. HUAS JQ3]
MTVIVHDKDTNRALLMQRSEDTKSAQGLREILTDESEPGVRITETTAPR